MPQYQLPTGRKRGEHLPEPPQDMIDILEATYREDRWWEMPAEHDYETGAFMALARKYLKHDIDRTLRERIYKIHGKPYIALRVADKGRNL